MRIIDSELGITVFLTIGLTVYMYLGFRRAYNAPRREY